MPVKILQLSELGEEVVATAWQASFTSAFASNVLLSPLAGDLTDMLLRLNPLVPCGVDLVRSDQK